MRVAVWFLLLMSTWLATLIPAAIPIAAGAGLNPPMTIRVGAYENPPKVYANREGIVVGIFPDILDTIAHERGWQLSYLFGTWEECLRRLSNHEIDVMVDIAHSPARGEKFLFTEESIFLNWAAVYAGKGVSVESLLDLRGKSAAVVKADIHTVGEKGIQQLDRDFDLGLTYVTVDSYRRVFEALAAGDAEVGVVNRLYGTVSEKQYDISRTPLVFNPVQLKFAFSRDNPQALELRRCIDEAVGALKRDPDSVFHEIINAYLAGVEFDRRFKGQMRSFPLSGEEKSWLRQHPTIRIGVDPAYPPYSFVNPDGAFRGVALDIIDLIGSHLGVGFEPVEDLSWPQILQGARDRSVDLVLTAVDTPERKDYLGFSQIYIPTPLVIMAREGDDGVDGPEDLGGKRVALVTGYASAQQVIAKHPSIEPVMVKTPLDGLTAVSVGEVDYYVGVLGANDYLMRERGIANLKVAARYDMRVFGQRFGVRSDWPALVTILDKAIASIPEKRKIAIFDAWIPMQRRLEGPAALQAQYALTAEETAWIEAHPVIRCGVDPEFAPFEFFSKSGVYGGIASDYVRILNSRLGLNLEVVPDLSWPEVIAGAKKQTIDVLPCVARTRQREAFMAFSTPYINFHRVIITRTQMPFLASLDDIRGLRVAVQADSSHEGYLKETSSLGPTRYATLQEALRAVAEGRADAFVGNIASATYWIRKLNLTNLKVAAPVSYEKQNLHFAIRKDWPQLAGIINKGLASISLAKENKIRRRWIEVEYKPGIDPSEVWKYVLWTVAGGLLVLTAILAWNYRLKKEIAKREVVEEDLHYRLDFETLLLELSSLFINLKTDQINREINLALERIAGFISADSGFVFRLSADGSFISNTHGWFSERPGAQDVAIKELDISAMPFLAGQLKAGDVVSISSVDELPESAANEKRLLRARGVEAIVSIPMRMGGSITGFLGVASVQRGRHWSDDEIVLLQAVGQVFCNALQRKEVEEALQQSHDDLERRVEERTADLAEANLSLQHEIIDRKRMEEEKESLLEQLIQSQKMEAIGTMAGGIAHDFNNILMPIMGYTELTLSNLPAGSKHHGHLQQVKSASLRAKDLVRQILTFSRHDDHEKRPLEVTPLVKETVKLLRSSLPSTIDIRETFESSDGCILGCPTQIHQVVMNLCTNAYHAMRHRGGVLSIAVSKTAPCGETAAIPVELADAGFVRLSVGDTGCGIDAAIKDRILEPYFTTKPADEGTGLGLSVVHGIVKKHGGHLTFHSEPDRGTRFDVFFPKIDPCAAQVETGIVETIRGGDEIVWVVDDDAMIAHMEKSMLDHFGYRVRAFTASGDLLAAFEESAEPVDLVVTDMTMPGMTGAELARRLIDIAPHLPIILCSGFSEVISDQQTKAMGIQAFIMKPVVMNDLAATVRRLLDGRSGGGQ